MQPIISRQSWGHPDPNEPGGYRLQGLVPELIVHHAHAPHLGPSATRADEEDALFRIWEHHVVRNGWHDIGYQHLVFQSGRVYEGRGFFRSGAHTHGSNSTTLGVCLVIDGNRHEPTTEAWNGIRSVLVEGIDVGALAWNFRISGHRDHRGGGDGDCPGDRVYPQLHTKLTSLKEEDEMPSAEEIAKAVREELGLRDRDLGADLARIRLHLRYDTVRNGGEVQHDHDVPNKGPA